VVVPEGGVQVVAPILAKLRTHFVPEMTGVTPSTEPKVPTPTIAELIEEYAPVAEAFLAATWKSYFLHAVRPVTFTEVALDTLSAKVVQVPLGDSLY
jgi:hypothetical protein